MKKIIILPFVLLTLGSCCKTEPSLTIDELYNNAIKDAIFAESDEIMHLVEITKQDENVIWNDKDQVLMCTFHKFPNSYVEGNTITTSWGESWLCSVKEFSNWYKSEKGKFTDYSLRSKQLLGLDPNNDYNYFSCFYVNPSDMFRPAFLPDITKQITELSLPLGVSSDYVNWFKENIYLSYFNTTINYPWTRLGYTYDWALNVDEYGLSEFVLKTGSEITVVKTLEVVEFYSYLENL